MGFRKNIDPKIQAGLNARVSAMVNNDQGLRADYLAPHADASKIQYTLSQEEQLNKSTYIRMISPGEDKTHVLYGMFNVEDTGVGVNDGGDGSDYFASLSDKLTGGVENTLYGNTKSDDPSLNTFLKPRAGITSVTVNFLKFGGAVRKATVNWVVFTLNDISKYQEGSFLSPGRSVILDWGWVRGSKTIHDAPKLLQTTNGQITLDSTVFAGEEIDISVDGKTKKILKPGTWSELYLDQHGDWSGLVGVVSKFSYSQRDDGGFDCTTEILAKGANVFDKPVTGPWKKLESGEFQTPALGMPSQEELMEEMLKVAKDLDAGSESPSEGDWSFSTGPTLDLGERIDTLDLEILSKYFKDNLSWDEDDPTVKVHVSNDKCVIAMLSPPDDPKEGIELYESVTDDEGEDTDKLERAAEFGKDIWVQWGWFEDHIISYYVSNDIESIGKNDTQPKRAAEFRSVEWKETTTEDPKNAWSSVTIKNDKEFFTYDPSKFIFPGQFPSEWCQIKAIEDDDEDSPYALLAAAFEKLGSEFMFAVDEEKKDKGYLRNIYINVSHIQGIFGSTGITIQSGMLKLAESLNGRIQMWSFDVNMHDEEITKYSGAQAIYYLSSGDMTVDDMPNSEKPELSYVFENYGMNSLLKEVDLSCTIPDKFAMQAGYGSSGRNKKADPIKDYFGGEKKLKEEREAEAIGEFFSDSANESLIGKVKRPTNFNPNFGLPDKDRNEASLSNLFDNGLDLSNSDWNHTISGSLKSLAPSKNENLMERFQSKYKDSVARIDLITGKRRKSGEDPSPFENFIALPDPKDPGNDTVLIEYRKPYDLDGKLRPHYLKTMKWFLEDSPIARNEKTDVMATLPLTTTLTLEGCGGLFPGHMFRLAYLPKSYGQVEFEKAPKSYFSIMGLTHTIGEGGWDTTIEGILNKYTPPETDKAKNKAEIMEKLRSNFAAQVENFKDPTNK